MAKIGEHRRAPTRPQSPVATASQLVLQLAAVQDALSRAGAAQARRDVAFQQDVLRARAADTQPAIAKAGADLGGLIERHERPVAARLKALFPSLTGDKGAVVVRRCKQWLRANKPAALTTYAARPMKTETNWVAVEAPVTPEMVQAVIRLADESWAVLGQVTDLLSQPADAPRGNHHTA